MNTSVLFLYRSFPTWITWTLDYSDQEVGDNWFYDILIFTFHGSWTWTYVKVSFQWWRQTLCQWKHFLNRLLWFVSFARVEGVPRGRFPCFKTCRPYQSRILLSAFIKQIDQNGRGRIPVNLCQNTFRHSCEAYRIKCKLWLLLDFKGVSVKIWNLTWF